MLCFITHKQVACIFGQKNLGLNIPHVQIYSLKKIKYS